MAATTIRNDIGDLFGDYQQRQQQPSERQVHQLMMEGPVGGRAAGVPMAPVYPTRVRCRGPTTPLAGVRFVIEFSSILLLVFLCVVHELSDVTMAKQLPIGNHTKLVTELNNQQQQQQQQQQQKIVTNHLDPPDGVGGAEGTERKINTSNGGSGGGKEDDPPLISFSPESLDFGSRPIGLPVMRSVHVANNNGRFNIQMISISGTTEHFHCSFFEEKMIGPRANTTFQVVFLGRQEGLVNNTLYIHSSVGSFKYHVSAFGEASPYRLRPLIGARVPVNGTFASLIHIYNPFSTPLQLTEMYSSGGGLFLDLPDELENIEEEELEDFSATTITSTTAFISSPSSTSSSTSSNRLQQRKGAELSDVPSRCDSAGSCGDSQQNQRNPPKAAATGGENKGVHERLTTLVWQVPPYETRPVVKAQFIGREAYNHTSYIRIRTNASDVQLMLPIEVEVSPTPDLYSSVDVIDFGTVRREYDAPLKRPILVVNAAEKTVDVQSITIKWSEACRGMEVTDFKLPLKVPQTPSKMPFNVGSLVLHPSNFTCEGVCTGKVVIKAENNNRYQLVVPYTVRMITGKLDYDPKQSQLFLSKAPGQVKNEPWELVVRNNFKQPMLIHSIKLIGHKGKECFRFVEKGTEVVGAVGESSGQPKLPISLAVGEEKKIIKLLYSDPADGSHRFKTALRLVNNITNIDIPIYISHGYLDVVLPNLQQKKIVQGSARRELNLGHIGVTERKLVRFQLMNENAASVKLVVWQCDIDGVVIHFVGIEKTTGYKLGKAAYPQKEGNNSDINSSGDKKTKTPPTVIPPGHRAIFSILLQSNDNRAKLLPVGRYSGKVLVRTQNEDIRLPITFNVLNGTLHASKVMLPRSFPGKDVTANILIDSTYHEPLRITEAFIEPSMAAITTDKVIIDNRFGIVNQSTPDGALAIAPRAVTTIQVAFNASKLCLGKLCYTALEVEREVGNLWLLSTNLPTDNAYIDKELYVLLRKAWAQLTADDKNPMAKVRLQIEGYGPMVVNISARLYWPLLTNKMLLQFPSTRLGRSAKKEFVLENPGDITILVQLMALEDYGHPDLFIQMMEAGMFQQRWTRAEIEAINATWQTRSAALGVASTFAKPFFLYNTSSIMPGEDLSPTTNDDADDFDSKAAGNADWMNSIIGGNTMTLLLPPGSRQRVTVAFHPLVEGNVTSVLIMRNNLTILDVITLRGEGGRGFLRLGSLSNAGNSNAPIQRLNFDYNEKLLERLCNTGKTPYGTDELDAKKFLIGRKFRATNIGRMAMTINRLLVDDQGCDSNGFLISQCKPVHLEPKQSFDFEIFYAPDFTQSEARHQLSLVLDDDEENVQRYPMVVKIPQRLLTPCRERLPLLPWRNSLKFCLLFAAVAVLVLSFFIGITDSKRVVGELKTHDENGLEDGNIDVDAVQCTCSNQRGTHNGGPARGKEIANGAANRKKSLETNGAVKSTNASNSQQQSKLRKRTKGGGNASNNSNNGQQHQKDEKRADTNNVSNGRQGRYKQANRTTSSSDLSLPTPKATVDKSLPASVLKQYDQLDEISSWGLADKKKESKEDKKIENGGHKHLKAGRANKGGRGDSESRSNSTNSSTTGGAAGPRAANGAVEVSSSRSSSVSPSENTSAASSVKNVEKYTPPTQSEVSAAKDPREKMTEKAISNLEKLAWQLANEKDSNTKPANESLPWKQGRWESAGGNVATLGNSADSTLPSPPTGLAIGEERAGKARALTMPTGLTDFMSDLDSVDLLGSMSQSNILQATAAPCNVGGDQWPFVPNPFRSSFDGSGGDADRKSGADKNNLGWLNKNVANGSNAQQTLDPANQAGAGFQNFLDTSSVSNSQCLEALQQKHSTVKDIWDLPITNFDSTNSKPVRNSNDYNDMERQHRFAFGSWGQTTAAPGGAVAASNNQAAKRKDSPQQPWKIDEWSNEIAKTSGIAPAKCSTNLMGGSSKQATAATTSTANNSSTSSNDNAYYYNQHRNNENIYETFFKNRDPQRKQNGNNNNNNQGKSKAFNNNNNIGNANRLAAKTISPASDAPKTGGALLPTPPTTKASPSLLGVGGRNAFFSRAIERPTSSNSSSTTAAAKAKNISPPPGMEGLPRFESSSANLSLGQLMRQQRLYERSNSLAAGANDQGASNANTGGVGLFDEMDMFKPGINEMANLYAVSHHEYRHHSHPVWSSLDHTNGSCVHNQAGCSKPAPCRNLAATSSLFDTDNVWTSTSPPDSFWKTLDGSNTVPATATTKATFAWPLSSTTSGFGEIGNNNSSSSSTTTTTTSGITGGSEPASATSILSSNKWASFDSASTSLFSGVGNNPLLMDHTSPWPSTSSFAKTLDQLDSNSFGLSANAGLISNGQPATSTGGSATNSSPLFNELFGIVNPAASTSASAGVIGSGVCRNASPLSTESNSSSVATNSVGSSGIGGSSTGIGSNPSPNCDKAGK